MPKVNPEYLKQQQASVTESQQYSDSLLLNQGETIANQNNLETADLVIGLVISVAVILVSIGIAYERLRSGIKGLDGRVGRVEGIFDGIIQGQLSNSNSPRQLNPAGEKVLSESDIGKMIEDDKEALLEQAKEKEFKTAYDAEHGLIKLVENFYSQDNKIKEVKEGAFRSGMDISSVFFVGGLHLRNLIFKDLGFDINDTDKDKMD